MITAIIAIIWGCLIIVPIFLSTEKDIHYPWLIWLAFSFLWIIPIFTGINVENNQGQYKGYITSIEKNGAIFKGYNVFLKSDLTSSNEDRACINKNDTKLIEDLKIAQENKQNVTLEYRGVWQFAVGECPMTDWMIMSIKN